MAVEVMTVAMEVMVVAMKFQEGGHRSQDRLMEAMKVIEMWHESSGWWPWKPG